MAKRKTKITTEMIEQCNEQLNKYQNQIDYDTKDYTLELLDSKYTKGDFFIPDYQRNYIWDQKNKVLFIESVLLGFPIPFMFMADSEDGTLEIIDGAQRIQTIHEFLNNELTLKGLNKLDAVNGFRFSDLPLAQQRRFNNRTFRVIELDKNTTNDIRQDLFNRINTTGKKANDAEIRRGSYKGPFTDFIEECCKNEKFKKICPIPKKKLDRYEDFELILRFFAYLNEYKTFIHSVNGFLDDYLRKNLNSFDKNIFKKEFNNMLDFVEENFEFGFAKTKNATTTPRVRFEAIAVGVGLALRENESLKVDDVNWIYSDKFKDLTTTDASNNTDKLRKRIEYVRDRLLEDNYG